MKVTLDRESNALYLWLSDRTVIESEEVQPGIILDFDEQGNVVGIEILNLQTRVTPEEIRTLQLELAGVV
jgi:uncharacterized protein YuzE